MESARDDLVVIFAGYADRMEAFFGCNPGLKSRVAHHIEFPDYRADELLAIGERMLERMGYRLGPAARAAFAEYLALRRAQPLFANARSVRNALDRARLRQASRLYTAGGAVDRARLTTLEAEDIRGSRVFAAAAAAGATP
jgi:hypothetical protein